MRRALLAPVAGSLALGVVAGLAWWLLAPTGEVVLAGDLVVAPDVPELRAAQDSWFVLVSVAAGLVTGVWLTIGAGNRHVARLVALLGGSALGSAVAWMTGTALGPASVAAQQAAGDDPLVSPLRLSAYGALGIWPAVAAAVGFVGLLLTGLLTRRET